MRRCSRGGAAEAVQPRRCSDRDDYAPPPAASTKSRSISGYSGYLLSRSPTRCRALSATAAGRSNLALLTVVEPSSFVVETAVTLLSTDTMMSAISVISAVPMPSVVTAAVPRRRPLVYHGPFGSKGSELRLSVSAQDRSADSACRPVSP